MSPSLAIVITFVSLLTAVTSQTVEPEPEQVCLNLSDEYSPNVCTFMSLRSCFAFKKDCDCELYLSGLPHKIHPTKISKPGNSYFDV